MRKFILKKGGKFLVKDATGKILTFDTEEEAEIYVEHFDVMPFIVPPADVIPITKGRRRI